jgi:hypothetical protein
MIRCGLARKKQFLIPLFLVFFSSMAYGDEANEISSFQQTLIHRLSQDGFDFGFLSKLLTDPRAVCIPEMMKISVISRKLQPCMTNSDPESILLAKISPSESRHIEADGKTIPCGEGSNRRHSIGRVAIWENIGNSGHPHP